MRIKWVTIHITLGTGPGLEGKHGPHANYDLIMLSPGGLVEVN